MHLEDKANQREEAQTQSSTQAKEARTKQILNFFDKFKLPVAPTRTTAGAKKQKVN